MVDSEYNKTHSILVNKQQTSDLFEHARAITRLQRKHLVLELGGATALDVNDDVADERRGAQRLRHDVEPRQNAVEMLEHAGRVLVRVHDTRRVWRAF